MWLTVTLAGVGGAALVAVAAEVYARRVLGLGDPPLWVEDPDMDYLPKPLHEVRRFGKRVAYNRYSMRSDDFPPTKDDPRQFRVLVYGDSIVHGDTRLDQHEVATNVLQERLAERLGRPVVVGNVSAGGWGPINCLAHMERFGTLDADAVMFVLNSHDYGHVPGFGRPLAKRRPQRKPALALCEITSRYLPRLLSYKRGAARFPGPPTQENIDKSVAAVNRFIDKLQAEGTPLVIVQHLKRDEVEGEPLPGYDAFHSIAESRGVHRFDLGPALANCLAEGHEPYRDEIHLNALGQRLMCEELIAALEQFDLLPQPEVPSPTADQTHAMGT